MGGKSARSKGRRGEYLLRDSLRNQGWQAERVPMSGAFYNHAQISPEDYQGDVKAVKDGRTLFFEMKMRQNSFGKIYDLYFTHLGAAKDDLLSFCVGANETRNLCVQLSTSLTAVLDKADFYAPVERHTNYKQFSRTFKKIANLHKLLGNADILVIKDNNKPMMYVRFF